MRLTTDQITTALGAVGAALTSVQPVINAANGSLHQQDYLQLLIALFMGVFGYFTNKKTEA